MNVRNDSSDLCIRDVMWFVECGSLSALLIIPFLYYVNGPAVSRDQLVVRSTLTALAVIIAGVFGVKRIVHWLRLKRRAGIHVEHKQDPAHGRDVGL